MGMQIPPPPPHHSHFSTAPRALTFPRLIARAMEMVLFVCFTIALSLADAEDRLLRASWFFSWR